MSKLFVNVLALFSSTLSFASIQTAVHAEISVDQAKAIASKVSGDAVPWVSESINAHWHRKVITLSSTAGLFAIDAATGRVVYYQRLFHSRHETPKQPVGRAQAYQLAKQWLDKVGLTLSRHWSLQQFEDISHGEGYSEWQLNWIKTVGGIRLPSSVSLTISNAGDVVGFQLIDDEVTISLVPNVSATRAFAVARSKANLPEPRLVGIAPYVWYKPIYPGKQTLTWAVWFMGWNGNELDRVDVSVDAQSGDAEASTTPRLFLDRTLTKAEKAAMLPKKQFNPNAVATIPIIPKSELSTVFDDDNDANQAISSHK